MTPEEFRQALAKQGIQLTNHQMNQFAQYYQDLVATNRVVNLTRITDEEEVYLKHFYDSITGSFAFTELQTAPLRLCDIGAGAGFPSLPLKIAFPQLKVTIVDSLNKRINFLAELVERLGLNDVKLVHSRAEDFSKRGSNNREAYDVVTARAVARLTVLSELCLPAVKVGGIFLAYKAQAAEDELLAASQAIKKLGGQERTVYSLELPTAPEPEERNLVIIDKLTATPQKYPRRAGLPAKKPL
ncbi:16S rRNA (guanine(527)-N(7))-methyltransferase RsmG [uncultured Limosilactobacillus sp.]|uniref:16S rRNA (guanine(527)-N(7))-methyltransferase RsmG n=1 Tax=uncultured Limosilactobacillus sp. TaxID=2837629 RepID=UPI0025E670EF|nr:16S rRNA (guanine(527)-N(7))-methyltransferase RsmG [uncultured Limosilactobacillus sp.]